MERFDLGNIFQGISTLLQADSAIMYARIGLILLGILLVYLGRRGVLEPLVMIPMGLGMAAVNAGVLIFPGGMHGNLFLDPMVTETDQLMNILQIDFLQPIYTFTFSNGLIACLIFMGIGTMLDINFVLAKPLQSMFLALCAELGTFAVVPIAFAMGLSPNDSASIAMVGGADGPMVLFASLNLSKSIFVPITVVAYLYLGLTYGGYPYLVRAMVPKRLRAIKMQPPKKAPKQYSAATKISLAVVMCVILCLLFPVAAPLFFSLFIGIVIKESGLKHVCDFISGPMLYGSTFFLGILLGILAGRAAGIVGRIICARRVGGVDTAGAYVGVAALLGLLVLRGGALLGLRVLAVRLTAAGCIVIETGVIVFVAHSGRLLSLSMPTVYRLIVK